MATILPTTFDKSTGGDEKQSLDHQLKLLQEKYNQIEQENKSLQRKLTRCKQCAEQNAAMEENKLLAEMFPLTNLKMIQCLHTLQLTLGKLEQDIEANGTNGEKFENAMNGMQNSFENTLFSGNSETNNFNSKYKKFITQTHPKPEAALSVETLKPLESANECDVDELRLQNKTLTDRLELLEAKTVEMEKRFENANVNQKFLQHLYQRIKSLECGRNGQYIWRVNNFLSIFANARCLSERKKRSEVVDENSSAFDFCSPLFYTSPQGYLMYFRFFPFGTDGAEGRFASIFIALSPGEYDGILKWPFMSVIEVSCINQEEPAKKWTQTIIPSKENAVCFQRPVSYTKNLSVGLPYFLPHRYVFKTIWMKVLFFYVFKVICF